MNNNVRNIITSILRAAGFTAVEIARALREAETIYPKIWVKQREVDAWLVSNDGVAYVAFNFRGSNYETNLRGRFQAYNCAVAIEIISRLSNAARVSSVQIENGLVNVPLKGLFETISKKPSVIFDTVTTPAQMKDFVSCVDDYYGRAMQKSLESETNLHPRPFRRLVICDYVSAELASIKQNITIIFTCEELEKQYRGYYSGAAVKTMVMPIEKAYPYALEHFSDYKILVIGGEGLYKKVRALQR